jgi:hypothetical protein
VSWLYIKIIKFCTDFELYIDFYCSADFFLDKTDATQKNSLPQNSIKSIPICVIKGCCMYVFAHINLHSMVQYSWKIPHANDVCCVFLILISGADTHDTQSACSDQTAEGKNGPTRERDMLFAGAQAH